MSDLVLILAAGPSREDFGKPRQLLEVEGEPLLARTVRLARECLPDSDVEVVTDNPNLATATTAGYFWTHYCDGCCSTILATYFNWRLYDGVVVLLGDVFYTEDAMRLIVGCQNFIAVFSDRRCQETFALTFKKSAYELMAGMCDDVVRKAHGNSDAAGIQALWVMMSTRGTNAQKIPINDRTQDFDTVSQYKAFLRGENKNGA